MKPSLRVAAVVILLATVIAPWSNSAAGAAPSLPSDASASGTIGLCNRAGQPVTSGSTSDKPFVWRAVGSQQAPSPYDGAGTSATLYGYQPRPNVPADQWSGDTLTASSSYTNKAHPMAQATQLDFTLGDLIEEYPPMQDGLIQLRLSVGAAQVGAAPQYASAFIQVDGSNWKLFSGSANFSCTDGSASSSEAEAGIVDKDGNAIGTAAASLSASAAAASSAAARSSGAGGSSAPGSSTPQSTAGAASSQDDSGSQADAAASTSRGSGSGGLVVWVVVAVVVVAAGTGVWWWRRRPPVRS